MLGREHLASPGRLAAFAQANGWQYEGEGSVPALGESLWEQASSGVVRDRISGDGWESGHITGGHREAQQLEQRGRVTVTRSVSVTSNFESLNIGYLAVRLPRRLPHMFLDAKRNNRAGFSSLQHRPRSNQKLKLEGDFNSHFTLFVPTGYERDALYVFTPDLMALLIDETGDLDIEIRDDQLFVYRPGGFDFTDIATWERFERIRTVLGTKLWDQSDRYLDERVETPQLQLAGRARNRVDPSGMRLHRKTSRMWWLGAVIAVAAVAFTVTIVNIVFRSVGWW